MAIIKGFNKFIEAAVTSLAKKSLEVGKAKWRIVMKTTRTSVKRGTVPVVVMRRDKDFPRSKYYPKECFAKGNR